MWYDFTIGEMQSVHNKALRGSADVRNTDAVRQSLAVLAQAAALVIDGLEIARKTREAGYMADRKPTLEAVPVGETK